jgi:predicted nuclease with TOPRIM domain
MDSNEKVITQFETRVKQLILKFQELKKENQDLYAMVEKAEQEVKDLQAKLTQKDNDYNALKMAKMMTITDGDLEAAKARIQKLIREVNKCITLVSDEKLTIKSE